MREIKFRGKHTEDEVWLFGSLIMDANTYWYIYEPKEDAECEVLPETVGQYTGLKDKNGKEIYEGDVVQYHPEANAGIGRVVYEGSGFYVIDEFNGLLDDFATLGIEIIGNIHDNPELIEGE